jgi:hypothetical protein
VYSYRGHCVFRHGSLCIQTGVTVFRQGSLCIQTGVTVYSDRAHCVFRQGSLCIQTGLTVYSSPVLYYVLCRAEMAKCPTPRSKCTSWTLDDDYSLMDIILRREQGGYWTVEQVMGQHILLLSIRIIPFRIWLDIFILEKSEAKCAR